MLFAADCEHAQLAVSSALSNSLLYQLKRMVVLVRHSRRFCISFIFLTIDEYTKKIILYQFELSWMSIEAGIEM